MVAFIASLLITLAMVGVCVWVGKRRPVDQPLTWGESFVAATWVFTIFLLIYGIVPNQWLLWADNELQWRRDEFFFGEGIEFFGRGRIMIPKEVVRDIVASVIYVVFGLAHIFMWLWWQKRGAKKPSTDVETSSYGRPLLRKV